MVPPPDREIRPGDDIAFTVRPEKLSVADIDQPIPSDMCTVAGTVVDVVYQGMSTQLVVQTDEGSTLVAFRQNRERVSDAGEPGSRVRLMWNPEYNVVLNESVASAADDEDQLQEEFIA
jgi:spermidine/putrescine transport system ATP-binding protein